MGLSKLSVPLKCTLWISLFAILIGFTLNNTYPLQGDESFYSVSSAWMVKSSNYMIPHYFGEPRFQKPILTYLIVAASYKIFGISLWSTRVPFILLACATLALVYFFSLFYLRDPKFGFFSVLLLSSSTLFISFSRIAMTDPVLTFFSTLALFFFAKAVREPQKKLGYHAAAFTATGLAFSSKGPAGLLVILCYMLYLTLIRPDQWKRLLLNVVHPVNIILSGVITLPWYIYVYTQNAAGLLKHISSESTQFTGIPFSYIPHHLLFYTGILLIFLLPFSFLAAYQGIKKKIKIPGELWLPLMFGITYFIFFSLFVNASRDRYLLPAFPALTIVASWILYTTIEIQKVKKIAVTLSISIIAVFIIYPLFTGEVLGQCVREWKKYKTESLAIFNLKVLQKGWVQVMAGGGAIVDSYDADYVITDEDGKDSLSGFDIIYCGFEREELRFVNNRPTIKGKTFYLLKRVGL